MTYYQKLFNLIFKDRGGIFIPDKNRFDSRGVAMPNYVKYHALDAIRYIKERYPNLPEIYVDFINKDSIGASGRRYKGKYYFGINIGTFEIVTDMFFKMLASKEVLTNIGDINKETDEKKFLSLAFGELTYHTDLHNPDHYKYPKDRSRFNYAWTYSSLVMQFLILHEVGHILRGHTALVTYHDSSTEWTEFESKHTTNSKIESWVWQTMEMDADSFATNHCFIQALANTEQKESHEFPSNEIYKDLKEFYKNWIFVMYAFFKLCGFRKLSYNYDETCKHPPNAVRLHMILKNILSIFEYHQIKEGYDSKLFSFSIKQAQYAFSSVTHQEPYTTLSVVVQNELELFIEVGNEAKEYMSRIAGNWNKIYELLEQFSFSKLPDKFQNPTPDNE